LESLKRFLLVCFSTAFFSSQIWSACENFRSIVPVLFELRILDRALIATLVPATLIPSIPAGRRLLLKQPAKQPFAENENGSRFGCLASY
jgi:hypothetical protein